MRNRKGESIACRMGLLDGGRGGGYVRKCREQNKRWGGGDANNGETGVEERKQAEHPDKRGKDCLKRQEFRKSQEFK